MVADTDQRITEKGRGITVKEDGGQAFPAGFGDGSGVSGMTLWDYYAGQALMGIMSIKEDNMITVKTVENDVSLCGAYADAMLAERKKKVSA
jgi:hypothetical protein